MRSGWRQQFGGVVVLRGGEEVGELLTRVSVRNW